MIDALPPPSTTHWSYRRKAAIVAAVMDSALSITDACERYDLSLDEFMLWLRTVERSGMHGLRVTKIQYYKSATSRQKR